ncbi:MAG: FtsX-like permease family protein, partial [Candidatus Heimdallarchaeota archaeon]
KVNMSVCRQSTDFGTRLFQYEPKHYYNITIRGIYKHTPGITMLQSTFSQDFIENSVIFLTENLDQTDIDRMEENGLEPLLVVKLNAEALTEDGVNEIIPKIELLTERLQIAQTTSLPAILDAPLKDLEQEFNKTKVYVFIMLPVILLGLLLALFTTNIVMEKRSTEVLILKERGGQKGQIIGVFLLEFLIIALGALLCSVLASLIVAAIIPVFGTQQLTWLSFSTFLLNLKVTFGPVFLTISAIIVVSVIYSSLKINQIFTTDVSEREQMFRNKVQQWILYGFMLALTLVSIVLLIVFGIIYGKDFNFVYFFSLELTQQGSVLFIILTFVMILLSVCASVGLMSLLGRSKWFYNTFLGKNGFFVRTNLRNCKFKFSPLLLILIIVTSTTLFSITVVNTLNQNEIETAYYNQGADLRISTLNVHRDFASTLTAVEGVEEVMPMMKISGRYGFDFVTLYGINVSQYINIGRWDESSFIYNDDILSENYVDYDHVDWLNRLKTSENGTFISDSLARRFELEIWDTVTISNLQIGASFGNDIYTIVGIIHSAPGLGLSGGENLALDQPNPYFMIVHDEKIFNDYGLETTDLFFASMTENADLTEVETEISSLNSVVDVNSPLEYISFGEEYVYRYVPSIEAFFFAQIILVNIIGLLVILTNIDFILAQRKQNNGILSALGNSHRNLSLMVASELTIINLATLMASALVAFPMVLFSLLLTKPFLLERVILPLRFSVNFIWLGAVILFILVAPILSALPSLLRTRRDKVAESLQPTA